MSKKRRNHSSTIKAKVVLETIKSKKTIIELAYLAYHYQLHANQDQQRKKELLQGSKDVFGFSEKESIMKQRSKNYMQKIGQLTTARDFCTFYEVNLLKIL